MNNRPLFPGAMTRSELRRYRWRKLGELMACGLLAISLVVMILAGFVYCINH